MELMLRCLFAGDNVTQYEKSEFGEKLPFSLLFSCSLFERLYGCFQHLLLLDSRLPWWMRQASLRNITKTRRWLITKKLSLV